MPESAIGTETSRSSFVYAAESAIGVFSPAALQEFLRASDNLDQDPTSRISTTIRSDRQVEDNIRENIAPKGDVNFNLSYKAPDDFFTGLLGSSWSSKYAINSSVSVTASTNSFASDTSAGGVSLAGIPKGAWIKTSGFTNAANNGFFKVHSYNLTGTVHTIVVRPTGILVDEAAASGRKINGSSMFNGVDLLSFAIERQYLDAGLFDHFLGFRVGRYEQTIRTAQAITGVFSFEGISAALSASTTIGNGTVNASPGNQEMQANDHVAQIWMGDAVSTLKISELTWRVSNALRMKGRVGLLGGFDIGVGRFTMEGTLGCYFEDRGILDTARAYGLIDLALQLKDGAGNSYIQEYPNVRVYGGGPNIPGIDQDVFTNFNIAGQIDHAVSGKMISFNRFDAAD